MLRQERNDDLSEAILLALQGWQAGVWTALPGIVEAVDLAKQTLSVQPAIQAKVRQPDGSQSWVVMPLLVDVPIVWPRAGGFSLTFPIKAGDEVLVVFSSRCIDAWWQSGGIQVQAELRMHDLSDGFAILAPTSQPRKLSGVSSTSTQLRSDDGQTFVEVTPTKVNVVAPSEITAAAPKVTVNASTEIVCNTPVLKCSGDIVDHYQTNIQTMAGMRSQYNSHTHTDPQGGNVSTPDNQM